MPPTTRSLAAMRLARLCAAAAGLAVLLGACSVVEAPGRTAPEGTPNPAGAVRRNPDRAPTKRGEIFLLGDSIMVGARDYGSVESKLEADGWTPRVVAQKGASLGWGLAQVRKERSIPGTVVVVLGTNPGSSVGDFASAVPKLVKELQSRGAVQILWVPPLHADVTKYYEKDRVLRDVAGSDVTVSEWATRLFANPQWFSEDKIHLDGNGYDALASFIADEVFKMGRRTIVAAGPSR